MTEKMRQMRYHLAGAVRRAFVEAILDERSAVRTADWQEGGVHHARGVAARREATIVRQVALRAVTGRVPTTSDEAFVLMSIDGLLDIFPDGVDVATTSEARLAGHYMAEIARTRPANELATGSEQHRLRQPRRLGGRLATLEDLLVIAATVPGAASDATASESNETVQ